MCRVNSQMATISFMVTPCINNIQHFNYKLKHTMLKNFRMF